MNSNVFIIINNIKVEMINTSTGPIMFRLINEENRELFWDKYNKKLWFYDNNHKCWCNNENGCIKLDFGYCPKYEIDNIIDFIICGNYKVYFPKINKIGSYYKRENIWILNCYDKNKNDISQNGDYYLATFETSKKSNNKWWKIWSDDINQKVKKIEIKLEEGIWYKY